MKIEVELNEEQAKVLENLIPFYGSDKGDVLKLIFIMWVHKQYAVLNKDEIDDASHGEMSLTK